MKAFILKIRYIRNIIRCKQYYGKAFSLYNYIKLNVLNIYSPYYWPIHKYSEASPYNIFVGKMSKPGNRFGCYIQGRGRLFIGDYVGIGPNTCIISGNHSITKQSDLDIKETIIGDHCWIASSCNILAGCVLGPRTIVGVGSVVTKSFPEGFCVIAGNPAKIIKKIDKETFIPLKYQDEFYGYLTIEKFRQYFDKHLSYLKFEYDISKVSQNEYTTKLNNK